MFNPTNIICGPVTQSQGFHWINRRQQTCVDDRAAEAQPNQYRRGVIWHALIVSPEQDLGVPVLVSFQQFNDVGHGRICPQRLMGGDAAHLARRARMTELAASVHRRA